MKIFCRHIELAQDRVSLWEEVPTVWFIHCRCCQHSNLWWPGFALSANLFCSVKHIHFLCETQGCEV